MKGLAGNRMIYELLLYIYFSEQRGRLSEKDIKLIGEFIKLCKAKDKMDNTQLAETTTKFYTFGFGLSVKEMEDCIGLSGASLYRFRTKIVDRLKDFLAEAE